MTAISARPLTDELSFGARVSGVDRVTIKDGSVRRQVLGIFERRGVVVFEDTEPSSEMQYELASVFGALRHHAMDSVPRVQMDVATSFMELSAHPGEADIFEVDGTLLSGWTPWHWDACYAPEIYRGGLVRALEIPPEGGLTGFADGVQLYEAISPELREQFENLNIVYDAGLMMMKQRFGMPRRYRAIHVRQVTLDMLARYENAARAVHPAIWQRESGEKVLHVSPWQAAGIEGREDAEGDALLETLCQEIYARMQPYRHRWKPTDMVVWDNWRFIHSVSGHDPGYSRRVHRATIEGDYGLGRLEAKAGGPVT
jgi:taurine dioxygenase